MPPAVRITAAAALTAHGAGLAALVDGIRRAQCPVRPATGVGYPGEPAPLASAFPERAWPPGEAAAKLQLLETVDQLVTNWCGHMHAMNALRSHDTALIVGGAFLYASCAELNWRVLPAQQAQPPATPFYVRGPHWGSALIADHLQLRGMVLTLSTGCSSSANALLAAVEMLQRGHARRVLVVGAEGLSGTTLSGFDALMLLAPDGCRPFDRDRAGLQIGEGVGAVMLEVDAEAEAATSARASLRGGANLCDTHHLTSASPDGHVMCEVMAQAIRAAGVTAADIVAVKAHGTGSIDSDRAEANALHAIFGAALPPVVGLKRHVGHTQGACGVVETVAMMGCLQAGFLPATAGFLNVDPEINITPTRAESPARRGAYLLNFFGFGGNYTSLIMDFK